MDIFNIFIFTLLSLASALALVILYGWICAYKILQNFKEDFPGKCPICSYHRALLREGLATNHVPLHHHCPEGNGTPHQHPEDTP